MKKSFVLGFLLATLLFSAIPIGAVVQEYILTPTTSKLVVDGVEVNNPALPMMAYNGYNYIPASSFREICDKIGVGFEWDNEKKEIQIDTQVAASTDATSEVVKEGDIVSDVPTHPNIIVDESIELSCTLKDGISTFTYDGAEYIVAKSNERKGIIGFESKSYNDATRTGFRIEFRVVNKEGFLCLLHEEAGNTTNVLLNISAYDKQYVMGINGILGIEYSYYQNSMLPLIS